jgi:hypothetical protein
MLFDEENNMRNEPLPTIQKLIKVRYVQAVFKEIRCDNELNKLKNELTDKL